MANENRSIDFREALRPYNICSDGSTVKVMYGMIFATGCRPSTLDLLETNDIIGYEIKFKECKTGNKRVVYLGKKYLDQLIKYRKQNRTYDKKLFGIKAHSFRRIFDKDVRPKLGGIWVQKEPVKWGGIMQWCYTYQFYDLRRNYQTLTFAKNLQKWKDPYVALQFTKKEMGYGKSGDKVCVTNYIQEFDNLNIDKWINMTPAQMLEQADQERLYNFV